MGPVDGGCLPSANARPSSVPSRTGADLQNVCPREDTTSPRAVTGTGYPSTMTLHVSALLGDSAYLVSDRWVTRPGEVWESTFNKNIVLRTPDSLVTVGFSGAAYLEGRPVDEWAVGVLWGEDLDKEAMVGFRRPDRLHGLSAAIRSLVTALNRLFTSAHPVPFDRRVHAVAVGWRIQGRRLRPCLLDISNLPTGGFVTVRAHTRRRQRFGVVKVDPPGWVSRHRLEQLNTALTEDLPHEAREDLMIGLLRELSRAGMPIGPDAMCIRLPRHEPRPTVRFAPEHLPSRVFESLADGKTEIMQVAYTPAIVTPRAVQLPSLTTGLPFENIAGFRVDWRMPPMGPPRFGDHLVWLTDRQPRR